MIQALSTASPPGLPIAVLGAGITGLSAAWHLRRAGAAVVLFEASDRVGGVIESIREDGWLRETGPNSVLEGPPELADAIAATGLESRRLYAGEAAKNRFVVRDGRLQPMPASPGSFLRTRLFSSRAKLRLATELFRARGRRSAEESVAEFTVRRLGREFLDYAIDPFVGGVYAGDPGRLSVRHAFPKLLALEQEHGSLLRGAIAKRNSRGGPAGRLFSFPDGLAELPLALARELGAAVRRRTPVLALRRQDGAWAVVHERGGETRTERFAAVICALPGDALARLRIEGVPNAGGLSALLDIEHPPVATVFTGFRREDVTHPLDGFGLLAPQVEHRRILGTLFSSSLFPQRAPAGHVALTTFVGGSRQPALGRPGRPGIAPAGPSRAGGAPGRARPTGLCPRAPPPAGHPAVHSRLRSLPGGLQGGRGLGPGLSHRRQLPRRGLALRLPRRRQTPGPGGQRRHPGRPVAALRARGSRSPPNGPPPAPIRARWRC